MISQPSGSTVGFSGERLLLVIPDALRFSEKVNPPAALGPLSLRLLFGEGASPREGGHRAAAKSTIHCSAPTARSVFRARALRLLHFAFDLPSGWSTMTDASGP